MMQSLHEETLKGLEEAFAGRLRRPDRDGGAVPGGALAAVLPLDAREVELIARMAGRYSIPLAAVGGGTSPEPVAEEGRLLIRFDLMRAIRLPEGDEDWVEAEPGIPWLQLDDNLRARGRGLAVYPTSAPRATVGGWLATDGLGVGSFEYGWLRENVLSASVVLPGGGRREVLGEEIGPFLASGGTEGIVVGARLRTRRADADVPFAATFGDSGDLAEAVTSLVEAQVPLWHLALLNPAMARARHLGETSFIFGAYPGERAEGIEDELRSTLESRRGRFLPAADAYRAWGERFFPVKPSALPPDFPSLSREFVSSPELPGRLEEAESRAAKVALQGTVARSGQTLLLTRDAREMT